VANNTLRVDWTSRPYTLKCRAVKWNWYAVPTALKPNLSHAKFLAAGPVTYHVNVQNATLSYGAASGYVFDFFVAPDGDDTLGRNGSGVAVGSLANPASLTALGTATYSKAGVLPGVYQYGTIGGVKTYFGAAQNAGTGVPCAQVPGGRTFAGCDFSGNYSPRQAYIDLNSLNPYTGGGQPISDGQAFLWNGDGVTMDGLVLQNCGSGQINIKGWSNSQILNCWLRWQRGYDTHFNQNNISMNGTTNTGANNNYIYNTFIELGTIQSPQLIYVTGIGSTGATLGYINNVPTSSGWPWHSMASTAPASLRFLDTGQGIGNIVTTTAGSNALAWTSTTITGTPNGVASIYLSPTSNFGGNPVYPNNFPYSIWTFYQESSGLTTPLLLECCQAERVNLIGNKTNPGQWSAKRCYLEIADFGRYDYRLPSPGEVGPSQAATGLQNQPGISTVVDHNIFVGTVEFCNVVTGGNVNALRGTLTYTNNTHYSPGPSGNNSSSTVYISFGQDVTANVTSQGNLYSDNAFAQIHFAVNSGTNYGNWNSDYNAYKSSGGFFRYTNTPANQPQNASGGTQYTLAQLQGGPAPPAQTCEVHSVSLGGVTPHLNQPRQGEPLTFAVDPSLSAYTVAPGGLPAGAIDGTVGKNGVACGVNFRPVEDPFPRIASYPIGSSYFNNIYNTNSFVNWAGKFNIMIYSWYIGIEPLPGGGAYHTFNDLMAQQVSVGVGKGITSRPFFYVMMEEMEIPPGTSSLYAPKLAAAINTNNWWLRTGWPAGSIVAGDFTGSGVVNIAMGGPTDAGTGYDVSQYAAWYFWNVLTQGKASSLFGEASNIAANGNVVGLFFDNQFWAPRSGMTGTWGWGTPCAGLGAGASVPYNNYYYTSQNYQTGQMRQAYASKFLWPQMLMGGNSDYGVNAGFSTAGLALSGQQFLYDVVMMEEAIGLSNSNETTSFTNLMNGIIGGECTLMPHGQQIVMQVGRPGGVAWTTTTNQANWVTADWQGLRMGEAAAWCRDSTFCLEDYNSNNAVLWWSDTWDNGGRGLAWMGYPLDQPRTAAAGTIGTGANAITLPSGVWGRRYDNAVVLANPRGNGNQTVTLPTGKYWTLPYNGFSDPAVNTHTQVNSVTLLPGDGRILATS